ncbi:MAG TPA: tRNA (adenosine(37)-N6)-threonylcarbamoyltransferase complex ATPase subunit type 1 TsaE [Candidatus Saccharimonadales bacterium]|nr:tRNA (adenosine(37)-N6)-threonylcarbamoyltransferase complex ATPase subunit type 1 TsaE [Candidatus Saccharimonadales bacterium]
MSTVLTWQTNSISSEQTEQLAQKLGEHLRGGEVIELVSDLGGGKTTFTRGLVRGAGSTDTVASPTFTISKMYQTATFEIHHFDFYRLQEAGIVADELAEVAGDPQTVVIVEWSDVVQHVLPQDRLTLTITQTPDGERDLVFAAPESLFYLLEAMQN